jgi:thiol-disulfide isomerase/thioredoxin
MKKLIPLLLVLTFAGFSCNQTPVVTESLPINPNPVEDPNPAPPIQVESTDDLKALDNPVMDLEDKAQGDIMLDNTASFSGTVLAGSTSPLLEFNEADYKKAVASDKLVVLYFYASWCPLCRAEFPKMESAFDAITSNDVVGFRVHFNDPELTDPQEDLAREFGVAYQHTKVFLKNGQRVLKSPETWDQARYSSEIQKAL